MASPTVGPFYGEAASHLNFSHSRHAQLLCTDCHSSVPTAFKTHEINSPGHAECSSCHQEVSASQQAGCRMCHTDWPIRPTQDRPFRGLAFSHSLPCRKSNALSVLHHDYRQVTMPSMGLCQDCHEETGAMNACHHCHQALPSGHLKTDFGHFRLKPTVTTFPQDLHTEDFDHSHAARMQPELCAECHQDDQCLDCHLSRRQLGIHPPDFLRHHAVDALQDSHRCVQCHTPEQFCTQCHISAGITQRAGERQFGQRGRFRQFHPPGFVGRMGESWGAQHHGHAARRSLNACVSCHSESDCVTCHSPHSPIGLRASPHPPQFRCSDTPDVGATGCLKCHTSRQELTALCGQRRTR